MIVVTGDTHIPHDWDKILNWKFAKHLTKDDYLIVAGDFGLIWSRSDNNKPERKKIEKLNALPFTTLFVDGNHENHERLNKFPRQQMFGGQVGVISDSIFHLRRGYVYDIPDGDDIKSVFTFGGAESIDQCMRTQGISWWPEEIPSQEEFKRGYKALEDRDWVVDYVVTHTAPWSASELHYRGDKSGDPTTKMLEKYYNKLNFKQWYHGHFHEDKQFGYKITCLYNDIVMLK